MTPDFSTRPRRRPPGALDLVLLAAGAAALVLAVYASSAAWTSAGQARRQVEEARRDARADQDRLRDLERAGGAALGEQARLSADAPPPRVVGELSALMPADVRLDGLTLSYGTELGVEMQVSARAAGAYDAFLQRLERSGTFRDVMPGDETREAGVHASIHATYQPAPSVPAIAAAAGSAR